MRKLTVNEISAQLYEFMQHFENIPPLFSSPVELQQDHGEQVAIWVDITHKILDVVTQTGDEHREILQIAFQCSKNLFVQGDDISAWLGQLNISEVAQRIFPGQLSAFHVGIVARYSTYMNLHEYAQQNLQDMTKHFTEEDHAIAHIYWELKGLLLSHHRKWQQAIPAFQKSLDHIRKSSTKELRLWSSADKDSLMANRLVHLADCWINLGWQEQQKNRHESAAKAREYLNQARQLPRPAVEQFLVDINAVEILLLEDNLHLARSAIHDLKDYRNFTSPQVASVLPLIHCLKARLSHLENNQPAMILHLSLALTDTNMSPYAFQEFQIINYALDLLQVKLVDRKQMEPLFQAMVILLEAKDWYTGHGHSKTVANLSMSIWDAWQANSLSALDRENLFWAAYLHDIGKLKLPRSLLSKISPLSTREIELIRKHPQMSKDILLDFGVVQIAHWAGEHHQDSQGTGYPGNQPASNAGLCIAIADIVEAATSSGRLYRHPKTISQVLGELTDLGPERYPQDLLQAVASVCNNNQFRSNQ